MADQKYDVRNADGVFEVKYWSPANKPILNEKNEVVLILHSAVDVTKETIFKQLYEDQQEKLFEELEAQVKAKTEQITGIFERISDGFIALDRNFNYTYANKRIGELLHMDPASLIGKNLLDIFPNAAATATYNAFKEAMETQTYVCNSEHYEPLNLWLENHIHPSPEGLSIFIRDTTERRRAETCLPSRCG